MSFNTDQPDTQEIHRMEVASAPIIIPTIRLKEESGCPYKRKVEEFQLGNYLIQGIFGMTDTRIYYNSNAVKFMARDPYIN